MECWMCTETRIVKVDKTKITDFCVNFRNNKPRANCVSVLKNGEKYNFLIFVIQWKKLLADTFLWVLKKKKKKKKWRKIFVIIVSILFTKFSWPATILYSWIEIWKGWFPVVNWTFHALVGSTSSITKEKIADGSYTMEKTMSWQIGDLFISFKEF